MHAPPSLPHSRTSVLWLPSCPACAFRSCWRRCWPAAHQRARPSPAFRDAAWPQKACTPQLVWCAHLAPAAGERQLNGRRSVYMHARGVQLNHRGTSAPKRMCVLLVTGHSASALPASETRASRLSRVCSPSSAHLLAPQAVFLCHALDLVPRPWPHRVCKACALQQLSGACLHFGRAALS